MIRFPRQGSGEVPSAAQAPGGDALARVAADTMDHWQPLLAVLAAQVADVVEHTERAAFAVMGEVTEADSEADRLVGLTRALVASSSASADHAARASRTTADAVTRLVEILEDRDVALRELGGEVRALNGHIEAINAIARAITILALNARIEASRAGEAGAGFAVVADEVGHLSRASAEAAESIRQGITQVTSLMERRGTRGAGSGDAQSQDSAAIGARLDAIATAQREMTAVLTDTTNATHAAAQDVEHAATALQGRTTAILAEAQFQDITRQSLEAVTAALGELGERVVLVATHLRDSGDVQGLRALDDSITALEATYVSQRQRGIHASTVGDHDVHDVAQEPVVELF